MVVKTASPITPTAIDRLLVADHRDIQQATGWGRNKRSEGIVPPSIDSSQDDQICEGLDKGVSEETTTGVHRLYIMEKNNSCG